MDYYSPPDKGKGPAVGASAKITTNCKPQARNREFGRARNALPSEVQTLGNLILPCLGKIAKTFLATVAAAAANTTCPAPAWGSRGAREVG